MTKALSLGFSQCKKCPIIKFDVYFVLEFSDSAIQLSYTNRSERKMWGNLVNCLFIQASSLSTIILFYYYFFLGPLQWEIAERLESQCLNSSFPHFRLTVDGH